MTPLHVAAERAHNDILEVLQKHGAKVCVFFFLFFLHFHPVCLKYVLMKLSFTSA